MIILIFYRVNYGHKWWLFAVQLNLQDCRNLVANGIYITKLMIYSSYFDCHHAIHSLSCQVEIKRIPSFSDISCKVFSREKSTR